MPPKESKNERKRCKPSSPLHQSSVQASNDRFSTSELMSSGAGCKKTRLINGSKNPLNLKPSSLITDVHPAIFTPRMTSASGEGSLLQNGSSTIRRPIDDDELEGVVSIPRSPFRVNGAVENVLMGCTNTHSIDGMLNASRISDFTRQISISTTGKPLVALLDGRDCSVEMPHLKDVATLAFCGAQSVTEIHDRVLKEAVAILMWDTVKLRGEDLRKFKSLRLIVCIGSDFDNIDVKSAGAMGIAVCSVPGYCIEEVADTTMCMILSLYRKVNLLSHSTYCAPSDHNRSSKRSLGPEKINRMTGGCSRIRNQTLGLVGLGTIGTAVAIRAKVFGFEVQFYDPNLLDGVEKSLGISRCHTLHELLHNSDCISLHCPLNESTRKMIDTFAIRRMRAGALLVNTSRNELVDEAALAAALKDGRLAGAEIDSCSIDETMEYILKDIPNLIYTPNIAWYSDSSYREVREAAALEVRRGLLGHIPYSLRNCVNKEYLMTFCTKNYFSNRLDSNRNLAPLLPPYHHPYYEPQIDCSGNNFYGNFYGTVFNNPSRTATPGFAPNFTVSQSIIVPTPATVPGALHVTQAGLNGMVAAIASVPSHSSPAFASLGSMASSTFETVTRYSPPHLNTGASNVLIPPSSLSPTDDSINVRSTPPRYSSYPATKSSSPRPNQSVSETKLSTGPLQSSENDDVTFHATSQQFAQNSRLKRNASDVVAMISNHSSASFRCLKKTSSSSLPEVDSSSVMTSSSKSTHSTRGCSPSLSPMKRSTSALDVEDDDMSSNVTDSAACGVETTADLVNKRHKSPERAATKKV